MTDKQVRFLFSAFLDGDMTRKSYLAILRQHKVGLWQHVRAIVAELLGPLILLLVVAVCWIVLIILTYYR